MCDFISKLLYVNRCFRRANDFQQLEMAVTINIYKKTYINILYMSADNINVNTFCPTCI